MPRTQSLQHLLLFASLLGGCAYSTSLTSGPRPGAQEPLRPLAVAVLLRSSDIKEEIDIDGPIGSMGHYTEAVRDALIECKAFSNVYVPRDGHEPQKDDIILDLKVVRQTTTEAAANKGKSFAVWLGLLIPAAFLEFTGSQSIQTTPRTTGGMPFAESVTTHGHMRWMYFSSSHAAGEDAIKTMLPVHAKEVAMVIAQAAARASR